LVGANLRLQRRGRWFKRICQTCYKASLRAHIIRKVRGKLRAA
jgi:hypothetical protein